jgi:homoserine dehydrogenase
LSTRVAIVGCGTVGAATARLLTHEAGAAAARTDRTIELAYIVDLDFANARANGLDESLYCKDYPRVLADPSVDVVVELVGGLTVARRIIEQALRARKHVVTANKALLAHHGNELLSLAHEQGVSLGFEASCGGGIPVIAAITQGLIANRITALYGILNGTCNYILTEMTREGKAYREALAEAQAAGFAEADPTLDVSGTDTAHKLSILSALAFGERIVLDSIPVVGIDTLEARDVAYGQELGLVVKLLAIAKQRREGVVLYVRPAFISKEHPLAWVSGPFNAVSVYGHATGHTMYYGRGAGGRPTASAVAADIHAVAVGTAQPFFKSFLWPDKAAPARQLGQALNQGRYYLRVMCEDSPGVLAQIAARLGDNGISISSVLQKEPPEGEQASEGVAVVITTYRATEGRLQDALAAINRLPVIKAPATCIEIVDEHPEEF